MLKMSPAGVFHSQAVTCGTQVRGEDLAFTANSNGRSLVDRRNTRHTASQSSAVPVCPGYTSLLSSACLLHARFHEDSVSLGREGRAVPCAQKPTALVRGPLQNCRSSTKHRLAARAQAAMGRPAVGQQQEAPAERSPL